MELPQNGINNLDFKTVTVKVTVRIICSQQVVLTFVSFAKARNNIDLLNFIIYLFIYFSLLNMIGIWQTENVLNFFMAGIYLSIYLSIYPELINI